MDRWKKKLLRKEIVSRIPTGFSESEHLQLNEILKNINGKFVLSYNDCEYIRELYKEFTIEPVTRNNNLVTRYDDKSNEYKELIIKNY